MDHIAAAEEQIATERFRRKLNEQAYFRCAYECFDRRRTQDEINNCVENCSVPVLKAQNLVETEMAKFQNGGGLEGSLKGWDGIYKSLTSFKVSKGGYVRFWRDISCGHRPLREAFPDLFGIAADREAFERLNRSLMVCQDKFDAAKTQQIGSDALKGLESCVDQSVQDSIKTLPHIVGRLKASLSISE
ncbi:hypothetical protein TEA_010284 [Camellia sinensis var. sinensis]|uniref:Uncharacterized protein n=1 Tax=Camellia sinensis var. sinensis TaxID=542762 RepID=A0A4S4DZX7_CAMSN|nr:hypothetical protein TEA_010284 [Camellia sinensis var. sinensis]